MFGLLFAKKRIQGVIDEIDRLLESEFAYKASKDALVHLKKTLQTRRRILEDLNAQDDQDVVNQECSAALKDLCDFTPLLGFILRSTNVRNAFEIVGPLLRLAEQLLEPGVLPGKGKTRLILSSEWTYFPVSYPRLEWLPNFVLIGFTASESSNPLLVPLAGHEFGHAVWVREDLETVFTKRLEENLFAAIEEDWPRYASQFPDVGKKPEPLNENMFVLRKVERSLKWCLGQAKEAFCDFLGLTVFGQSFLYAFAYLLSPNNSKKRSPLYPNMLTRVDNLEYASRLYDIPLLDNYRSAFKDRPMPEMKDNEKYLLHLADRCLETIRDELAQKAKELVENTDMTLPTPTESTRIFERFKLLVPAEGVKSLADILNAAWPFSENTDLWNRHLKVDADKDRVLNELVLKNIEVFHVEQLQEEQKRLQEQQT